MRGPTGKIALIILIMIPLRVHCQEVDSSLLRMQAMYARGDYQSIMDMGLNNQLSDDELVISYLIRGRAAYQLADYARAIGYYNRVEEIKAGMASLDLAHAYRLTGDNEQMFRYLRKHLESEYKLPRKEIMLDPVFSGLERDRDWIRFWSEGWYDENDDLIAEAEYKLSRNDTDFDFWTKLIRDNQDIPVRSALIGQYYHMVGDNRKAVQFFEKALEEDPGNTGILIKYGNFLVDIEEYRQATNVFSTLCRQKPYEIKYYLLQVMAIIKSGDSGRALQEMNRLRSIGIDSSELNLSVARVLIDDDPAMSIEYIEPVIESNPSAEAFNLRAKARKMTGELNGAIEDYAMSLDIDPKQPGVYYERGHLRLAVGDRRGACYDWNRALNLGHRNAADMLYKYCK